MILLLLSSLIFAQAQFSISPLSIEEVLAPGAKKQIEFVVYNESKTDSVTLHIYSTDIIQATAGNYEIVEIGKGVPSCATWIKIKDSIVILKPDSAKAIIGSIQVPRGIKGGRYGAVVVENKLSPDVSSFKIRMPIIVKINIKPFTKPRALITDVKVEDVEKSEEVMLKGNLKNAIEISASVKNESDRHIINKGRLIIRDKEGKRIREVPLGKQGGVILPNSTVDIKSIINRPPVGEYIADISISYGAWSPAKAVKQFEITKQKISGGSGFSATQPLTITLMPENIDIKVLPKAFRNPTIILHNEESNTLNVRAEIKELTNDESGEIETVDNPEDNQWSCSKYINIEPAIFTIKPNERKPVKLNIQTPDISNHGERYAQIAFNINKDTIMPGIFTVPVFLTYQGNSNPELKVEDVRASNASPIDFNIYIRNIGDIRCKPTGKITVERKKAVTGGFGENTITIGEFQINTIKDYVFPDRNAILHAAGPLKLEKGKYNIRAEIYYSQGKYTIFEKEITI